MSPDVPFHRQSGRDGSVPNAKRWPWVALTALLIAAFLPFLTGRIVFGRDLVRFLHPMYWFVGDSFHRGASPWWMPHIGLGHSLLADPQSAIFYPPNLLHRLGSLPQMMMAVYLLHLAWGAAGMVKLARAFRLADVSALIAGLTWALSGYVASLWTNGARLPAAAWMPWQALACVWLAGAWPDLTRTLRAMAWLALVTGLAILAGDPFVALMGAMLGFALALTSMVGATPEAAPASHSNRARVARFVPLVLLASALGGLLAAAAWVPAARAVSGTERAGGLAAHMAQEGSLHPVRLLEFAAPEAFARAWYESPAERWVADYLDGAPLSFSTYLGGSVLVLMVLAFLPGLRDRQGPSRRMAALVAAVGVFFLVLALGRHTPMFSLVRTLLPPVRYMRAPEKFLLGFVPCAALLAGWGAERLREHRFRWRWAAIASTLVALAVLASFALPSDLGSVIRTRGMHGLGAGALVLVCWSLSARPILAGALLVSVLVLDLATATGLTLRFDKLSSQHGPALAATLQPSRSPVLPFPRLFRGNKVQVFASRAPDIDGDTLTRETLRDNLSVPLGIAILPGYGVAIPPALTDLLAQGRLDALRLLAVDYALLSVKDDDAPVPDGLVLKSKPLPGVRLYEVQPRLPRTFVAAQARKYSSGDLARHLLDPDVVAGTTVLLDDKEAWMPAATTPEPPTPCTLTKFENDSIEALCDSPRPGLAVFVEQFAPGWHATVDGAPAPVMQANALMRAVPVAAGRHAITLTYSPPGLSLGIAGSMLGLCTVTGLALAAALRRRREEGSRSVPAPAA